MKTIIVAGCARSGLTATMQMLYKGGYPCLGDWPAFENFPIGHIPWNRTNGHAVKVVATHIQFPPPGDYHVVRLVRDHKEQAKSMGKLLRTLANIPVTKDDIRRIQKSLAGDYKKIDEWAQRQKSVITIQFGDIINHPHQVAEQLADFSEELLKR